jgi:hypothetical protein
MGQESHKVQSMIPTVRQQKCTHRIVLVRTTSRDNIEREIRRNSTESL